MDDIVERATSLAKQYGFWGNHPDYHSDKWRDEVESGETRQGYWFWVAVQIDNEEEES